MTEPTGLVPSRLREVFGAFPPGVDWVALDDGSMS
ncbi:hypothetical protein SAMN04488548_1341899 [Gordonia westfalica]|uniref:Uncharacterized protein n=1 Tax=Gordonia westfalica TaxID=158898 RepID=A0A1H2J9Y9_9ACTN|nr:hypothetical protein SAMN04488548_1341899 [Gordonia westfalica]